MNQSVGEYAHPTELPMPAEVKMPQLSDTMSEGTLVKWNKKEGDKVRAGEEIAACRDAGIAPFPGSVGNYFWSGIAGTFFWIDPKSSLCAVILMQTAPFFDEPSIAALQAFEKAVYQSIA